MPKLSSVKSRTRVMNIDKESFDTGAIPVDQHDDIMRNAVTFKSVPSHVGKITLSKNLSDENFAAWQRIAGYGDMFGKVQIVAR
jgi:hypothetical protein